MIPKIMLGLIRIFALFAVLFSVTFLLKHRPKDDLLQKSSTSALHFSPFPPPDISDSGICPHCSCIIHKEINSSHESSIKKDL